MNSEFGHVTYTEAIEILEKNNDNFDYKVSWGCDLQTEHERYLTEEIFKRPVFVTDYPVEIKRIDDESTRPEQMLYPQKRIQKRNYGAIVEQFTEHLATMEDNTLRDELTILVANHMKRDLSNWSVDSMSDEKIADDMASYTNGKIQIDFNRHQLISDGELLSSRISTSVKKKKKR